MLELLSVLIRADLPTSLAVAFVLELVALLSCLGVALASTALSTQGGSSRS